MALNETTLDTLSTVEYSIGDIVYLKTDTEQNERIIIGILILQGCCMYLLASGDTESWHYGVEMTTAKNLLNLI